MVTQATSTQSFAPVAEPSVGAIRNQAARIRNQWSPDERLDRQHQALLFQQQLLKLCGLVPSDGLEDVITVSH
jgi:hypothetical protein